MTDNIARESGASVQRGAATLQEIDTLFQATLDILPAQIVILDSAGVIIVVNAAWRRFGAASGYSGGDGGLGISYLELHRRLTGLTANQAYVIAQGIRAVSTNAHAEFSYEYAYLSPAEPRWFTMRVIRFAGVGPAHLLITHEDNTRHKQIEDTLHASEMSYRALVEHLPIVTYTAALDQASSTLYVSPQIELLTGFSPAAWTTDTAFWFKQIHPDDRDRVAADLAAFQASGTPVISEYRLLTYDGRVVWVRDQAVVVRDNAGRPLLLQGVYQDITERKQADEALRHYAERLNILHQIDQAILSAKSLEAVAQVALRSIYQLISFQASTVLMFDFDSREVWIVARFLQAQPSLIAPIRIPFASVEPEGFIETLLRGETNLVDLRTIVRQRAYVEQRLAAGIYYQISVPLLAHGEVFGAIQFSADSLQTLESEYMPLVREIIDSVAVALHQARLFEQVRAGRERLRDLSQRLVAVQEIERRQIARDLHDQIGQSLTVLNINLTIAREHLLNQALERADGRLADSLKTIDEMAEQLRDVTSNLRPAVLDDYGLAAALRWYLQLFSRRTKIAVSLEIAGPEQGQRPPLDVEIALFRIAQEALNNVAKHAQARTASVLVQMFAQPIRLVIGDDGRGFILSETRAPSRRRSLGLIGMQERAEAFGARLIIESVPGAGTRIIVEGGQIDGDRGDVE